MALAKQVYCMSNVRNQATAWTGRDCEWFMDADGVYRPISYGFLDQDECGFPDYLYYGLE